MKICTQCEKENPSTAHHCMYCGAALVEVEQLPEEVKLQKKLNEANETITLLKQSLAAAQEQLENSNNDAEIKSLQKQIATKTNKILELNAQITKLKTDLTAEQKKKKGGAWGWFFVLLFIAASITFAILGASLSDAKDNLSNAESRFSSKIDELTQKYENLTDENSSLQSQFDDLREKFPLKITRIELANVYNSGTTITDFGATLYSYNIRYLKPKIYFTNYLKEGKTFNFTINYYNSQGKLEYNTSNGNRPTSNTYISITDKSATLSGWGSENGGTWSAGTYNIEIWADGVCLGSKKFTIY